MLETVLHLDPCRCRCWLVKVQINISRNKKKKTYLKRKEKYLLKRRPFGQCGLVVVIVARRCGSCRRRRG